MGFGSLRSPKETYPIWETLPSPLYYIKEAATGAFDIFFRRLSTALPRRDRAALWPRAHGARTELSGPWDVPPIASSAPGGPAVPSPSMSDVALRGGAPRAGRPSSIAPLFLRGLARRGAIASPGRRLSPFKRRPRPFLCAVLSRAAGADLLSHTSAFHCAPVAVQSRLSPPSHVPRHAWVSSHTRACSHCTV